MSKEILCDSCSLDSKNEHRCRADETLCVDGIECPDYQEFCSCSSCWFDTYE